MPVITVFRYSRFSSLALAAKVLLILFLYENRALGQSNNRALYFDGLTSYVNLDTLSTAMAAAKAITIELKVKCKASENDSVRVNIFAINPPSSFQNKFALIMGDSVNFQPQTSALSIYEANNPKRYLTFYTNLGDGLCHHIAVVRDSANTFLYEDGVLLGSLPAGKSIAAGDRISLGQEYDFKDTSDFFKGMIDDVRIWDYARSAAQIKNNINTPVNGNEPGLIAAYDFNQGIAGANNAGVTLLMDQSINAFHGKLKNFALQGSTSNWMNFINVELISSEIDSVLCVVQVAKLSANSNLTAYDWSNGQNTNEIFVDQTGSYWLEAFENSCSVSDTISLEFIVFPEGSSYSDTVYCTDFLKIGSKKDPAQAYLWQDGITDSTRFVSGDGLYWIQSRVGSCIQTDSFMVHNLNPPQPIVEEVQFCEGEDAVLDAYLHQSTYLWDSDLSTSPQLYINAGGVYVVERSNICGISPKTFIVEEEDCACYVYVPNSFTPNSDKYNNSFGSVVHCHYDAYRLRIYNRWGQLVFSSSDPFEWWDGSYQGLASPDGVYNWIVEYHDAQKDTEHEQQGHVWLMR